MELTDQVEKQLIEKFRKVRREWNKDNKFGHGADKPTHKMFVELVAVGARGGIIRCYPIPRECIR